MAWLWLELLRLGTWSRRRISRDAQERREAVPERYDSDPVISVGRYQVVRLDAEDPDVLAVFRDDALIVSDGPRTHDTTITMQGPHIADRLGQFGIDRVAARDAYDAFISDRIEELTNPRRDPWEALLPAHLRWEGLEVPETERNETRQILAGLDFWTWVERTRAAALTAPSKPMLSVGPEPHDFWWLWGLVFGSLGMPNQLARIRLALIIFPEEPVTLTFRTVLGQELTRTPSNALRRLQHIGATFAPTVVLTEGSTDAEFLRTGLQVIYPHLTDLVRFLDPHMRAEGSAGALANTVKAFAAAGITNRIVAAFDDDSAATDAMRSLKTMPLPPNIFILQFPSIPVPEEWLVHLPELEDAQQPTQGSRRPQISGCVEMYLGADAIRGEGDPMLDMEIAVHHRDPLQYEGRFADKRNKNRVQDRYRRKVRAALANGGQLPNQDWSGMAAVLHRIITAHQSEP